MSASEGQDEPPLTSQQSNTEIREHFGRVGVSETWQGVSEQPTLDAHTQGLLDARGMTLIEPGQGLHPVQGAGIEDFTIGDRVSYRFDAGLGVVDLAPRIVRMQITVDEAMHEHISVQFA